MTGRSVERQPPPRPGALLRTGASLVALAAVLAGKAMIACRIRRAPEGWRRTVGILLRATPTHFALSAFGLRVPEATAAPDEPDAVEHRTARGLLSFLTTEPDAHFSLEWRPSVTVRRRTAFVDLVVLRFAADHALERIEPYLAPGGPPSPTPDVRARVHAAVMSAYNGSARLPEVKRPLALRRQVEAALASPAASRTARQYSGRLLNACCLSFDYRDLADPVQRFSPPDFTVRRSLGFGFLSFVARPSASGRSVDVWVSAHHVGLDGVPLQDMLSRLERAWGRAETVLFPAAGSGQVFAGPDVCNAPGERQVHHLLTFVDFSPVFALREDLNRKFAAAVGSDVTFGALIAWLLSRQPEFAGVRIASTVDIAASGGYERDVDVVALRPADYATGSGMWDGFVEFAREFNRLISACRTRISPIRVGMQTAGLLPAGANATSVRSNPTALDDAFGSLCVTIIRDASVFVAPMTDLGLGHGFFAIGSARLPTADGRQVASVSIKGDAGTVERYPTILQRVVDQCVDMRE